MSSNSFSVTVEYIGHKWEVSGTYDPGRPAPICSNHDSPAFSDPGDPAELEIESLLLYLEPDRKSEPFVLTLASDLIDVMSEDNQFYEIVTQKVEASYGDEADRGDYEYERQKDRRAGI